MLIRRIFNRVFALESLLLALLSISSTSYAAPTINNNVTIHSPFDHSPRCPFPIKRKEWRTLSPIDQLEYIAAVKCLASKPALTSDTVPGAVSRFDDFQGVHILHTDYIHYVGQFLPWHRYYLKVYETALREECGYQGAQPYWDWTLDVAGAGFNNSPIFDPTTGLGGNGVYVNCSSLNITDLGCFGSGGGCITDGPFKNHVVHMGPGNSTARNDQCIKRSFWVELADQYLNPTYINNLLGLGTFEEFRMGLEGPSQLSPNPGPHGAAHVGVGGTMIDFYGSPGDPIFPLHHTTLDRIWWQWQSHNCSRLFEISGPTFPAPTGPSPQVTLDYQIEAGAWAPTVTIEDVMDIRGETLCYEYE